MLSVAGLAFLARTIAIHRIGVETALRHSDARWLAVAASVGAAGIVVVAVMWGAVMRLLGIGITYRRATALYFRGEIAKYVPGGVWSVIGRGELARRDGVPGQVAYASVLLSLAGSYTSCAVVAAAFSPFSAGAGAHAVASAAVVIAVAAIGVAVLHPRVLAVARALVQRVSKRELDVEVPPWSHSVRLLVLYAPAWLAIGVATWAVVRALGGSAKLTQVLPATATSWLAGFLAVPVPGGIGVREAVFVAAVPSLDAGTAAAAALVARILFMLIDAGGATLSWLAGRPDAL